MSHRTAMIEEEFDDDTDLPLPSFIPNTGARGPLLQEVDDDDYDISIPQDFQREAGPASPPKQPRYAPDGLQHPDTFDMTPYKSWVCIYPIYLDAKRPYGTGERRISRAKALWWPLSKDITEASIRLGLGAIHEVSKYHPRDWENPGRVRIGWKVNGKLVNPNIKTKKQLMEMISFQIQLLKPENIPKEPYSLSSSAQTTAPTPDSAASPQPAQPSASSKGKQPASSSKSTSSPASRQKPAASGAGGTQHEQKSANRPLPVPPLPYPPLSSRISQYSPALSTGVLIDTVKAGMNAAQNEAALPGVPGMPAGMGKGKRKVVRVRG